MRLTFTCFFPFPFPDLQSTSGSLNMLVRAVLLDKKPDEVPMVRFTCLMLTIANLVSTSC